MLVNALLPAILVFIFAGVYFFLITPLKGDLLTVKTKVGIEFHKTINEVKAGYKPMVGLSEEVVSLSRKASNLVKAPNFCQGLGVDLISVQRDQSQGAMPLVNGVHYPTDTLVRVSFNSAAVRLRPPVKDWLEEKKKDIMGKKLPDPDDRQKESRGAKSPVLPGCALAEKTFKTMFGVLDDAITFVAVLIPVILPLENLSSFPEYVADIYAVVRYPEIATLPADELGQVDRELTQKVKESAQRLEELKIKDDAIGIGRRISTLLTIFKYLAIALAVWFGISYLSWIFGRLEHGWKMLTGKPTQA
jgi:hypothetical protein